MTRRRSTISSDEISDRNVEMATRASKAGAQAKEDARAIHILGGVYPAEAQELARAARTVRQLAPDHAPELLDMLGLTGATP